MIKLLSGERKDMMTLKKIDDVADLWNKTKDPKYRDLWYKYIKEWCDGNNNSNRRIVPFSPRNQRHVKGINFDKRSWYNLL